jgi:SAM-dependent methyltransferase/uncharacterized protein YbaR (Trm112 family)
MRTPQLEPRRLAVVEFVPSDPAAAPVALVCPYDHRRLQPGAGSLSCPQGHSFPLVDGIPVLLRRDAGSEHRAFGLTFEAVDGGGAEGRPVAELRPGEIDAFVQNVIVGTCGNLYAGLRNKLGEYPIPEIELPPGDGRRLLEVGCSWGRWCIAAARRGYVAVGVDPRLGAVRAARRVARQLGVPAWYYVGDGRFLPFEDGSFDVVYCYGVLQHFPKPDVVRSLAEIRRVLRDGGRSLVQMATAFGARGLYQRVYRALSRTPDPDPVRLWSLREIRETFEREIGPSTLSVHAFGTLNPTPADVRLLPWRARQVVRSSEALRRLSRRLPALAHVADSVFVSSTKRA